MADKFEREIDEILSKLDRLPRRPRGQQARQRASDAQRAFAGRFSHVSTGQLMLAAIAVVFFSFFLRSALPFASLLISAGLILFFAAFALSFFSGGGTHRRQVYWRGRPAETYYGGRVSIVAAVRDWWRRRQGRGRA